MLGKPFANVRALRAKRRELVPVVYSIEEVARLLGQLRGINELISQTMYGSGLRVGEAVTLRVKDIATTQIYLHAVTPAHTRVRSPLADVLARGPQTRSPSRERLA